MIIGWRGEIKDTGEQLKDEPQHIQQGEITLKQLEVIDIPYEIISADDNKWKSKISQIIKISQEQSRPVALVCRKNTFEEKSANQLNHSLINTQNKKSALISRENAIKIIARKIPDGIPIFSTTGMASRELYEFRKGNDQSPIDFYTVGGMGCSSSIAIGFLRGSEKIKKVVCIDGDGSAIMHMGSLFKNGKEKGIIHII